LGKNNCSETKYPILALLVRHVLYVPTTGAPVEGVFSQDGIIEQLHHASLSPQKLQLIMLLKCNEHILDISKLL